uniref:NADH dehydrogenase subunit 6 n=1 Tax=Melecta chinensis TaxID=582934 RepID=UPI002551F5DB|nr:NADH dehydrogenase subunit 6 [Melecta chinensis]WFP44660.1 NADH dehydrogenase subunit 6 [Melecta chinensis]
MNKLYLMIILNMPIMIMVAALCLLIKNSKLTPIKFIFTILSFMLLMNFYSFMFIDSIYILIIMFMYISGLLTLFAYFISLMNKKIFPKNKMKKMLALLILIAMIMSSKFLNSKCPSHKILNFKSLKLFKIYSTNHLIYIMLMLILLAIILVINIKICLVKKKALRQKKDE